MLFIFNSSTLFGRGGQSSFFIYWSLLKNWLIRYCHHMVESYIVGEFLTGHTSLMASVNNLCSPTAHSCKSESFLRPSRWRWRPNFGPCPYCWESLIYISASLVHFQVPLREQPGLACWMRDLWPHVSASHRRGDRPARHRSEEPEGGEAQPEGPPGLHAQWRVFLHLPRRQQRLCCQVGGQEVSGQFVDGGSGGWCSDWTQRLFTICAGWLDHTLTELRFFGSTVGDSRINFRIWCQIMFLGIHRLHVWAYLIISDDMRSVNVCVVGAGTLWSL